MAVSGGMIIAASAARLQLIVMHPACLCRPHEYLVSHPRVRYQEIHAMSVETANPAPGFARHPDYKIKLTPAGRRMRVIVAGCVTVAESDGVLAMREGDYPPVYYFPREDVNMELLTATDHGSTCPFKGAASYWTIEAGGRTEENVAWSYETPYDEMLEIAGTIAFYQDRVKLEVVG
jgi:uncharacterized protein (DUF427 family)